MGFPSDFIDRVRDSSDIIEVISQYVSLKKRGANFLGLCPFHNEKTPSFSVSPSKAIYKCFGCGAAGNVFTFIMQREKMLFPESVEFLAKRIGLDVPQTATPEQRTRRDRLYAAANHGHKFFREHFKKNPLALKYLESRSFTAELAEKMEIGYAPDTWDEFTKSLKGGHKEMVTAGLLREKEGRYYDYFRSRLIFPIKDLSGRVCAFGGRYLGTEDEPAKYLNSPETPIYNKGSLLYNIAQSREAVRDAGFIYLVEGYTDLLRLLTCGIDNCAAGLGTALTPQQARLIRRYTEKVALLYDGDDAGRQAAIKGARILMRAGLEAEIISLPEDHDPDSFLLKNGREGLEKIPRLPLLAFQLKLARGDVSDRRVREKLALEMLESALSFHGEMKRSLAIETISEMLSIPVQALTGEFKKLLRQQTLERESDDVTPDILEFAPVEVPERDLLRILLSDPASGEDVYTTMNPDILSNPMLKNIFITMKSLFLKGQLPDVHILLNEFDDPAVKNFIADSALWEMPADRDILLTDAQSKLREFARKRITAALKQQIKEAASKGEDYSEIQKKLKIVINAKEI